MDNIKMIADYMGIKVVKIDHKNGFTWWRTDENGEINLKDAQIYSPCGDWSDLMPVVDAIVADGVVVMISMNPTKPMCLIQGLGVEILTEHINPIETVFEAVSKYVYGLNENKQ